MTGYAVGKDAFGFCDRCGLRYDLAELKNETVNGTRQSNLVCPECWDEDHPQRFLWILRVDDPNPLRETRPDQAQEASRGLSSWSPVGNQQATSEVFVSMGVITVVTA